MEALARVALSSASISSSAMVRVGGGKTAPGGGGGAEGLACASAFGGGGGVEEDEGSGMGEVRGGGGRGDGGGIQAAVQAMGELNRLALCFVGIIQGMGERLDDKEEKEILKRYLECECGTVLALTPPPAGPDFPGAAAGGNGGGRGRGERVGGVGGQEKLSHSTWAEVARGALRRAMQLLSALLRRHSQRSSAHAPIVAEHVLSLVAAVANSCSTAAVTSSRTRDCSALIGAIDDVTEALVSVSETRDMSRFSDSPANIGGGGARWRGGGGGGGE
jgi:hypothetical protein